MTAFDWIITIGIAAFAGMVGSFLGTWFLHRFGSSDSPPFDLCGSHYKRYRSISELEYDTDMWKRGQE